jgi:sugar diacid utilization regulator
LRVALLHPSDRDQDARRRLAAFGALHDAGSIDGLVAEIITVQENRPRTIMISTNGHDHSPSIAISAVIPSARQLPEAVRQARYIAGLQQRGMVALNDVQFDDDVQLGAFRLLYDQWGTPEQHRYIEHVVGDLLREDRRGQLRETLLVYLQYGGAQRPTSERLGIHRNTLTYRMRQIREFLSLDPDDPTGRLGLHLALLGAELPPAPPQLT